MIEMHSNKQMWLNTYYDQCIFQLKRKIIEKQNHEVAICYRIYKSWQKLKLWISDILLQLLSYKIIHLIWIFRKWSFYDWIFSLILLVFVCKCSLTASLENDVYCTETFLVYRFRTLLSNVFRTLEQTIKITIMHFEMNYLLFLTYNMYDILCHLYYLRYYIAERRFHNLRSNFIA